MFVKRGYRKLAEDTATVIAAGFLWMDFEGQVHEIPAEPPQEPAPPPCADASYPVPTIPDHALRRNVLGRLAAVLLLPAYALRFFASAVGHAFRQFARDIANCRRDMTRFRQRYQELHASLVRLRPRLLVVGQDSLGSELSFLLIAAGRLGIPRLVTPFAMFSLQETAEYAKATAAHHVVASATNKLVAVVFPHWVLNYCGENLLRLPGYRALALEMTGLVKGLPWVPLSEPVEAITAGSEVAAEAMAALGIHRDSLHVIGSPIQDRLAGMLADRNGLRMRLCQEYGLAPEKPLLVCGWPVNMFAWLAGRRIAYGDYQAVAATWAKTLAEVRGRHGVNVIISVHPKTLQSEIAAAKREGIPCRHTGADELIAAADLFTTLNGSSITAWAIACGIPIVLFDCFLTRYPDFLTVPGCVNVETEEDFSAELHTLCQSSEAREALSRRQRDVAERWGQLDGRAGIRLGKLMRKLTKVSHA